MQRVREAEKQRSKEAKMQRCPPSLTLPLEGGGMGGGVSLILVSLLLCFLLLCFLFLSACSFRKPATAITANILSRGMIEVESEEDVFVARETALPLLKILEVLHQGDPKNKKFLGLLAKVYGNYAFGFAELEAMKDCHAVMQLCSHAVGQQDSKTARQQDNNWLSRTKRFYEKGLFYGLDALARGKIQPPEAPCDSDWCMLEALSGGRKTPASVPIDELGKFLKKFGKKDVSTLFWTAFDWGSYINMSRDDVAVTADLPRVQAIVDRVIEIDTDFTCGVAHAFKGALLAGNPFLTGSRPEVAKPHFEKAMSTCDGNYLMNKVMYAEWYLKTVGDGAGFKKVLGEVISADAGALPSQRLANEIAKERARLLLHRRG